MSVVHDRARVANGDGVQRNAARHPARSEDTPHEATTHEGGWRPCDCMMSSEVT